MSLQSPPPVLKRPIGVTIIAIINGAGFFLTLAFWMLVFFKRLVPLPADVAAMAERANAATTYGFMLGDLLWSLPLLFLAATGLWRIRFWGWTAAQLVNALWIYSLTVLLMRDIYTALSPGVALFLPFAIISIWATWYLWANRKLFWK
jgi:hypothetical protein